jgi:hypothetical protein
VNRSIDIEILVARGRAARSKSKNLCESSRALNKESKALIQRAKLNAMGGGQIVLPKKPPF